MGTKLRKYKKRIRGTKLKHGSTAGWKKRLTDKNTVKIQNYYEEAIRWNARDKEGMKNDIWATFKYFVRDEIAPLNYL